MSKTLGILLALGLMAGTAFAQHPMGMTPPAAPMGMPSPHMMGGMDYCEDGPGMMHGLKGCNLSKEQQASLDKLKFDFKRKGLERKAVGVDLQTKLKLAMTAEKFSQKEVDEIAVKLGKFHQEGIQLRTAHMRQVRELLTPEQRICFDQMILSKGMGGKGCGMSHGMGADDCGMGRGMGMKMKAFHAGKESAPECGECEDDDDDDHGKDSD